ncbi:MAG TPA: hypothetical protein VL282_09465, partial [Tepidisphaeraceae bacterium]|nr:hypothetical protein [Tepidisphaeraceae bacterium]
AVLKPIAVSSSVPIAILIPFTFAKSQVRSILVLIDVGPANDDQETRRLLADADASLKRSGAAPNALPPSWRGYATALSGLSLTSSRRASLVYLCRETKAPVCEDFALSASDADLSMFAPLVQKGMNGPGAPRDEESLSWFLDATTLQFVGGLQTNNRLPPELLAMLLRHTGQVGMNSGSVAEMIAASRQRQDFDARVVAENIIYLEDGSPAARVRACEWLGARGKAPSGYDPLAPPRQRQAALEKMYEAMTAQAAAAARKGGQP